ncbi:DUF1983 domain-containing protein, partial [Klebsiella quasipneumoniae]
ESITSLSGSISTLRNQVSNPWFDGSLESYADGQQLYGGGAVVTTAQKFNGSRSLRLRREANNGDNSDKQIGPWSSIRENAVYSIELWAMMPADQSPSSGWQTIVGIQGQNAAGQNSWQGAVTITESGLGSRGKWVKFSGKTQMNGTGRTRGVVWISTRGATGSGTPGYDLYIDDVVITDITDAQDALNVADASTTAVNSLTTRVTDAENKITAQSQQLTSLQSSLNGKADAGALNSLTSRVTSAEGKITSTANSLTSLNSTVGTLSSTVQAQGNTLVDTNNKISSMYSIKVETNNGKKVGAGIVLGSDGSTSDMILYADRFSLFNRNSKTAVPVMIAEGNELYIDSARLKNGSIDNAKIGDFISSSNYNWNDGLSGWMISKNGACVFNSGTFRGDIYANNGYFRGQIEATSGTFKGAVEANSFVGDIAAMGVFPAFNGNVKSRLIHHDTSNKGGKSFCIQGIVRWIAGNERSTIGIECWVNGQRVSRITFNTSDIGSSLIGYLPFQGTKTGISTQDTLVEVVITNSISASLVSGTCIMSRGSGNWENIG